jgi:hypothetical protein
MALIKDEIGKENVNVKDGSDDQLITRGEITERIKNGKGEEEDKEREPIVSDEEEERES